MLATAWHAEPAEVRGTVSAPFRVLRVKVATAREAIE